MKFCVLTLGCKVNSYESEYIKEKFLENDFCQCSLNEGPDVIVINTCSVTNQSDAKSRHMIRLARRECPKAILAVCGCSAQNHQYDLEKLDIDILLGNKDKSRIVEYIKRYIKSGEKIAKFYDMSNQPFEDMMLKNESDKTRAFVKIQDGCDNYCSYCIIPYMRGNIRSKDIDIAVKEIDCLVEMGHKEIVLTGIHTGSYGRGKDYDLVDLIQRVSANEKLKRIRISSIEVTELDDKFLQELANNHKLCDHMHIPLQSGSDVVLKKMNRKYDTEFYRQKIAELRKIRPDMSITTDLIVGFPFESEEEFEKTCSFIEEIGFSKIHTFPFSLRNNTRAEEMKDDYVDELTKHERVKKILDLSHKLEIDYYKRFIGKTLEVIVETTKDGKSKGHTSNYILVNIDKSLDAGKIYEVLLTSLDDNVVNGTIEKVE